jgi:hypothetical protein
MYEIAKVYANDKTKRDTMMTNLPESIPHLESDTSS